MQYEHDDVMFQVWTLSIEEGIVDLMFLTKFIYLSFSQTKFKVLLDQMVEIVTIHCL